MALRIVFPLAISALLLACGGRPTPDRSAERRASGANRDSLVSAMAAVGRSFGESRAALRASLGPPDSVTTQVLANRHVAGETDSGFVWWYRGRRFGVLRPGPVGRDLLLSTDLWDPSQSLPGGIRVDRTRWESVEPVLAPASRQEMGADTAVLVYLWPPDGAADEVRFMFVADTLRRVTWVFYVD